MTLQFSVLNLCTNGSMQEQKTLSESVLVLTQFEGY